MLGLLSEAAEIAQREQVDHLYIALPLEEQLPKWRVWATKDDEPRMQEEAFAQLA